MASQFHSLFTLQVLHDYYNQHGLKCPDFDIVPTEDCVALMKNMQVLHKHFGNKLVTLVNASSDAKPFLDFTDGLTLRFYLRLNHPYFNNFTSVSIQAAAQKRFYFSNLSKHKVGTTLSLSNAIESFSNSKTYAAGDLVIGTDGHCYTAVSNSDDTSGSKDLNDVLYWQKASTDNPYVSKADEVTIVGSSYTYKLETASKNIAVQIFRLNKANSSLDYDVVVDAINKTFSENQETFVIDFSTISVGKYKVVVNGEPACWLYVDPSAERQNVYSILEIHHFEKLPVDFQLLDVTGKLKSPELLFTIWFKNRSVVWKYISQSGKISVTDADPAPQIFEPILPDELIVQSKKSIPLTETPLTKLTLKKTTTGKTVKNLQNPQIEKLAFEKRGGTGYYVANMFIKIDA